MDEILLLFCAAISAEQRDMEEQSSESSEDDAVLMDNSRSTDQHKQSKASVQPSHPIARPKRYPKKKEIFAAKTTHFGRRALKRYSNRNSSSPKSQIVKRIKTATPSSDSEINLCDDDEPVEDVTKQMPDGECNSMSCKVALAHKRYPDVKLTDQEITKIKKSLLAEIDEIEEVSASVGFVSSVSENGWLLLTCQNTETRDWLMNVVSKLNTALNMDIKAYMGIPIANSIICTLDIPPDDIMAPDALKRRLAKQNLGLSTTEWRFLNAVKNEIGGESVTFSIDEKSKECMEARGKTLFLNFSQTSVEIT